MEELHARLQELELQLNACLMELNNLTPARPHAAQITQLRANQEHLELCIAALQRRLQELAVLPLLLLKPHLICQPTFLCSRLRSSLMEPLPF